MIINHNISALNSHRNLGINNLESDKTMERLSSGMRINRGADDAAGLAVSEKMRSQIRGLSMASRNAQDGISFIQTSEGFLQETTAALQRIRELSVQSANGVYTEKDRQQIQTEVGELVGEIQRIAEQSEFNQKVLFSGQWSKPADQVSQATPAAGANAAAAGNTAAAAKAEAGDDGPGVRIHVGANMDQYVRVFVGNMSTDGIGLTNRADGYKVDVTTVENANRSIAVVDEGLYTVNKQRTDLGAMQNRLETAMRGIDVATENLQSAESRIRDTDMAKSMIEFVKDNILSQSAVSMLAQANLRPQMILRILG